MRGQQRIEQLLHEAAGEMNVGTGLPSEVRGRIRRGQGVLVGLLATALIGASAWAIALPTDTDHIQLVGPNGPRTQTVTPMQTGTENGTEWKIDLYRGPGEAEQICVTVSSQRRCLDMTGYEYEDVGAQVDWFPDLRRVLVVVKTAPGLSDVVIREIAGTSWAALVALEGEPGSDQPSYWYRFLEGPAAEGTITVGGARAPMLYFSLTQTKAGWDTILGPDNQAFPELGRYPGEKEEITSGPEAGGYSVVRRTTDSLVCFHIWNNYECRDVQDAPDPIGIVMAQPLRCAPADDCAPGSDLVIVAGEVAQGVARIGLRDSEGESFVAVGEDQMLGCCLFSRWLYGNPGDVIEVIAYDDSGDVLGTKTVTFLERSGS